MEKRERPRFGAAKELVPAMECVTSGTAAPEGDGDAPSPSGSVGPAHKKSRLADRAAEKAAEDCVAEVNRFGLFKNDGAEFAMLDSLPSDALTIAIEFVGLGCHRYVAGTCRRLREAFGEAHPATEDGLRTTYWSAAADSVPCAALCLQEAREQDGSGDESSASSASASSADESATAGPRGPVRRIGEAAAERTGRLDVLRWLEKEHNLDPDERWDEEQRERCQNHVYGHSSFFLFYHDLRSNDGARLLVDCAALGGNLRIIRHYVERGCFWDGWTVVQAALGGHAKVLKFFLEEMRSSLKRSNLSINFPCVAAASASRGHLEVLQYIHGLGISLNCVDTMIVACRAGHTEVVNFVHDIDPIEADTPRHMMEPFMYAAAAGGQLRVLEYLHDQGVVLGLGFIMREACRNGHLDVVKFLLSIRPIEDDVPRHAKQQIMTDAVGHDSLLDYLHKQGW